MKKLLSGRSNLQPTTICSSNPPVEYPKRETKHDIKESESNMFHPIFTEMAQMQKYSGRCVVAETKLPS